MSFNTWNFNYIFRDNRLILKVVVHLPLEHHWEICSNYSNFWYRNQSETIDFFIELKNSTGYFDTGDKIPRGLNIFHNKIYKKIFNIDKSLIQSFFIIII